MPTNKKKSCYKRPCGFDELHYTTVQQHVIGETDYRYKSCKGTVFAVGSCII